MSKRILLCDDEIHILRAAEFKFKRAGYDVVLAGDGEEGWQAIQQQLPDIVVTDCQMPRLSGLGLAERIKNDPATCHLPVIMLSGKGFELSESEIQEKYGIRGLIGKPFSPRELFQQVETLLAGGELAAANHTAASQWL
jgi:two-component system, OmpR family, alkaline phosphatase synthesis response regulator PhoP